MEKIKILLIEDDEYLRNLYTDILTGEGYEVETAEDGEKGLRKIQQGGWNLILLDIILPGMNGLEIMRQVKEQPAVVKNGPVVFITNLYEDTQRKDALTLGSAYLVKSNMTPDVFLKEIKKFLPPI